MRVSLLLVGFVAFTQLLLHHNEKYFTINDAFLFLIYYNLGQRILAAHYVGISAIEYFKNKYRSIVI